MDEKSLYRFFTEKTVREYNTSLLYEKTSVYNTKDDGFLIKRKTIS